MNKPRKLKSSTRILYLRRDLRIARAMLEVAAVKLSGFAREIEQNTAAQRQSIGSDMREVSSECARLAEVCNGW